MGLELTHWPPPCRTCRRTFSRKAQGSWSECCKKPREKLQDLLLMSAQNITSVSFYSSNKSRGQPGFTGGARWLPLDGRTVKELGAILRGFLKDRVFCLLF